MDKEKLLDHLWDMYIYHQEEADKFEKGEVESSRKHFQTVANVFYKIHKQVADGEFDLK